MRIFLHPVLKRYERMYIIFIWQRQSTVILVWDSCQWNNCSQRGRKWIWMQMLVKMLFARRKRSGRADWGICFCLHLRNGPTPVRVYRFGHYAYSVYLAAKKKEKRRSQWAIQIAGHQVVAHQQPPRVSAPAGQLLRRALCTAEAAALTNGNHPFRQFSPPHAPESTSHENTTLQSIQIYLSSIFFNMKQGNILLQFEIFAGSPLSFFTTVPMRNHFSPIIFWCYMF